MKFRIALLLLLSVAVASAQTNDLETFGESWSGATRWTFLAFMVVSALLAFRTFRNKPDV